MERGGQGRGRREEEKGYEIIQPQQCLLLIVYMYSAGTSASWPDIMLPFPQIHQFTFCIVCQRSPLLSWCIPRSTQKPGPFVTDKKTRVLLLISKASWQEDILEILKVTVIRTPGVKTQLILKTGTQT